MGVLGYHASNEQFSPNQLLDYAQLADNYFDHAMASDHFHPWSGRQGESGHVWAWLGAAMATTSMTYGTVNAPGYRYHPVIVAQGTGTLRAMFPARFWLAVGSGQLLNEGITGTKWPDKAARNARLEECAEVIRRLWDGEKVTHHGHVDVELAKLYTRPDTPPPLIGAALSEETATWLAEWADGMITLGTPDREDDTARVEAFRNKAPDKPIFLKAQFSYDEEAESALNGAFDQWQSNCVPGPVTQQLRTPDDNDELSDQITEEDVRKNVRVSADLDDHIDWIERDLVLGVDRVYLHNVNTNQERFIEQFGENVLPNVG